MRRRRIFGIAALAIGVPLVLLIGCLLYVLFADLGGWRDTVARRASEAIGRELRIRGRFEPEIGLTTRVVATDITLANAEWGREPQMLSVDSLAVEVDLLSILSGPIDLREVEISGARMLFEVGPEGRLNWNLGDGAPEGGGGGDLDGEGEPAEGSGGDFELVIGHALVDGGHLVYAGPQESPRELRLSKLEFVDDGSGMLDLELDGTLDQAPIELSGRLGTFIGLINASRIEHDLAGRLAGAGFRLSGTIDDLSALSGIDAEVSLGGPSLSGVTSVFGIEPASDDRFAAELSLRESDAGQAFELEASVGEMTAELAGTLDSLVGPEDLDVTVDAAGPDFAKLGDLIEVGDLPSDPFTLSGRVRWAGFPLICEEVEIRIGDNSLSAHGELGKPPRWAGTDFRLHGAGPDTATVGAIFGLELPGDHYAIDGRLVRVDDGVRVEGLSIELGGSTLGVDGYVGDPPGYESTALTFQGEGPSLARFDDLVGIGLPPRSFSVRGALAQGEDAIQLEGVCARLGRNTLEIAGRLSIEQGWVGTDLRWMAEGPDASEPAAVAGLSTVPAEPFRVEGSVRILDQGYRVRDVVGSLGGLNLEAAGLITRRPKLVGTDLRFHLDDPDIRHPASIVGLTDLPLEPIDIEGRIRVEDSGYRVTDLDARVGEIDAKIDGIVGRPPDLEGTDLRIDGRGDRVAALGPYLDLSGLPAAPFALSGNVRLDGGSALLDEVRAEVAGHRARVSGTVALSRDPAGTDLDLELAGPDLGEIPGLVAGLVDLPELAREPYSLHGGVAADGEGFDLRQLELRVATSRARLSGRLGAPPEFLGSDLTIDIDSPAAPMFIAMTGIETPVAPLELKGRFERNEKGYRFHDVTGRLGEYRASAEGTLGELPKLIGTDLEIHASGPDTSLVEELTGWPDLAEEPFSLSGSFSGTPEQFASRDFSLALGPSDLEGSFAVDIRDKPKIRARLAADVVVVGRLHESLEDEGLLDGEGEALQPAADDPEALVIPDEPLDLAWLKAADADVEVRIDELILKEKHFSNLLIDAVLDGGRLEITRLTAGGLGGGTLTGGLVLEPVADGYHLWTDLSVLDLRAGIADSEIDLAARPSFDVEIDLAASGATPHEMASSANGVVQLVVDKGVMDTRVLDLLTTDILITLVSAFNPFSKQDEETELQCGVVLLSFDDGVAKLDPMAIQSDKMTLLGSGRIDFETEKLRFEWVTKTRKGVGISASVITNPSIRLGGTLANPSVQLDQATAVVSTGAAVATLGMSWVARGLLDRITAEKKVCKKALKEIERR